MGKKEEIRYGNVTLGTINKMLISFIGESVFYHYCKRFHDEGNIDYQSDEAFQKYIGRLVTERDCDFRGLNPYDEDSVYNICKKIIDDFENNYDLPRYVWDFIFGFTNCFLKVFTNDHFPVYETYRSFLLSIYEVLKYFVPEVKDYWFNRKSPVFLKFTFLSAKEKYAECFARIYNFTEVINEEEIPIFKNKKKFCSEIETWLTETQRDEKTEFNKIIDGCVNEGKNPSWKKFLFIFKFLSSKKMSDFIPFLLEAYITANIEKFIKSETQIPTEYLCKIKEVVNLLPEKNFDLDDSLLNIFETNQLSGFSTEIYASQMKKIKLALKSIMENYIYLEDESKASQLLSDIKDVAPHASEFYCNWLTGFMEVAKGHNPGAKNYYRKAFEARRYAGIVFEYFIKQAIALLIYVDSNPDTIRNSVESSKTSTNPLPKEAKQYWNYGYAVGIFEKPAEETHQECTRSYSNFVSFFPETMFFPHVKIKNKIFEEYGIICTNEDINKILDKDFNRLRSIKNSDINTRVRFFNGRGPNKLPPLSLALHYAGISYNDLRFLDLAEKWLGLDGNKEYPNLNIDEISDMNVTPLDNALMEYKRLIFQGKNDARIPRLKKIVFEIIKRASVESLNLNRHSFKQKRCPLQEAIETGDIEIVKVFVDRGFDIDSAIISADEVSPVYYALQRMLFYCNPEKTMKLHMESFSSPDTNINWKSLNIPGFNDHDKMRNFNAIYEAMQICGFEKAYRNIMVLPVFGVPQIWSTMQKRSKDICLYLIEKTKEQDKFILFNQNVTTEWTSLYFSAEINDDDICRAFLKRGANPNLHLRNLTNDNMNTFIYRCIGFESWKVLEMYLREFKNLAASEINNTDNPKRLTPLTCFLNMNRRLRSENRERYMGFEQVKKFCELFRECGADFNIPSSYGSANQLVEQFKYL